MPFDILFQGTLMVTDVKGRGKPCKRRVFLFEQLVIFSEPFERKTDWTVYIYRHSIKVLCTSSYTCPSIGSHLFVCLSACLLLSLCSSVSVCVSVFVLVTPVCTLFRPITWATMMVWMVTLVSSLSSQTRGTSLKSTLSPPPPRTGRKNGCQL